MKIYHILRLVCILMVLLVPTQAEASFLFFGKSKGKNPDKIQPKYEPLSEYGNPQDYIVDGIMYKVSRTANGFTQTGIASWYGSDFHKKRTSSGEPYDMYAFTAAHKTLPLPCYLKVRNLENGREITVRVNDRGPFHSERILDLSYSAAKELGITREGTAKVYIEAIVAQVEEQKRHAHFYIQVAAYNDSINANRLRDKLQRFIDFPVMVAKKAKYYVVFVGPLENNTIIDNTKQKLASHGFKQTFTLLR